MWPNNKIVNNYRALDLIANRRYFQTAADTITISISIFKVDRETDVTSMPYFVLEIDQMTGRTNLKPNIGLHLH